MEKRAAAGKIIKAKGRKALVAKTDPPDGRQTSPYIAAILDGKDVDPITNEVIGDVPDQYVKFVIIR
jgi:hypothetical protein